MLGNDIVDLSLAKTQSNWRRRGYLNKLFTATEQALIASAKDADLMVWLLWSMKESAYKIQNRNTGERLFNPIDFESSLALVTDEEARGQIRYKGTIYCTKSTFKHDCLHTVSIADALNFENLILHFLVNHENYLNRFNNDHPFLRLFKDNDGLPKVEHSTLNFCIDASVSHHGKYLAIAYPDFGNPLMQ
ncbi:4'-phosphopantetheinyl transferase family protein [Pedobacter sandarakinus]|uniref:4'-phosphopantetheinyl transferase family protein n=1 Tax=Pedobacter sandarakinus TaxID=353156 RepID=UPI0022481D3C|nr:4'-phosphopantetheinyl transferase superfamily protein [Pedobacter sandarakinus]MCX2573115.1 4'-phosphopantetheinyl transferase superfamily protein [Pedobacter sandarakinus]